MSYHFGCCMACRAPFLPDTTLFYQEESQAVFYLQARFKQISSAKSNSDFTGKRERSHLLSRSHFSQAVEQVSKFPPTRVFAKIPGWEDDPDDIVLTQANSFFLTKTKIDDIVDKRVADQGANVDAILVNYARSAVEDFDNDPANAALVRGTDQYNEDLVTDLLRKVASTAANSYFAAWPAPQPTVSHSGLRAWLAANLADLKPLKVNLDFTTPCCSLCNDIWDCWARMRQVLAESGVVPLGVMVVDRPTRRAGIERNVLPVDTRTRNNKSLHQQRLGCLAAYYLHASLASICNNPAAVPAGAGAPPAPPGINLPNPRTDEDTRKLISMLLWLPMHITCMHMEMQGPLVRSNAKKNKGQHNYTGCIDLSISYYLWLLARAHSDLDVDFPFDRFSTLYLKEIVECPPPVWDAAQHPRLHSFIFDETRPASERVPETVAHVSNRLVLLYADKIAPLVPFMKGGDVDSPDPDFRAAASSYFISGPECTALMARYNTTGANEDDIRYFIEYAGIAAVLWQMRRYLANEPEAFQAQLDQWLTAVVVREWHNIADNSPEEISLLEAQLIYNMQNALAPEALTGPGAALGSGVEISLLRIMDEDAIKEILEETGRCSIFKAARRLRDWQFTRSSALRPGDASDMGMGAKMGLGKINKASDMGMGTKMGLGKINKASDTAMGAKMRLGTIKKASAREIVRIDTGAGEPEHLQSHASARRFIQALMVLARTPPYNRRPIPCALSARLISAKLASTPAMSTDVGEDQGAGRGRAASRRGCRGRG